MNQLLIDWRTRLEALADETDVTKSERVSRDALRDVGPLLNSLSGIQLDDARFVAMLAHNALDHKDDTCRFAVLVQRSPYLPTERKDLAGLVRQNMECAP